MLKNKEYYKWSAQIFALLAMFMANTFGHPPQIGYTLAVTVWVGIWWITEAVPIPFASLIPFILLPAFGVIDFKMASSAFGSHVIILLLGAFLLANGLEASGVQNCLCVYGREQFVVNVDL